MATKKLVGKERTADLRLRREYQITFAEREKVFNYQGRVCAMCKQRPITGRSQFSVDHRHSDGLLRGLLCWKCNRALGAFQRFHPDCVELFQAAADYLRNPPFTAVFKNERYTVPGRIGTKKRTKALKLLAQGVKSKSGAE